MLKVKLDVQLVSTTYMHRKSPKHDCMKQGQAQKALQVIKVITEAPPTYNTSCLAQKKHFVGDTPLELPLKQESKVRLASRSLQGSPICVTNGCSLPG